MSKQKDPVRFEWIDLAKFTSIFLVVLFHSPPPVDGTVAGVTLLILRIMHANDTFFDGRYDLKLAIAAGVMVLMWIPVHVIDRYFPFITGRGKIFKGVSKNGGE